MRIGYFTNAFPYKNPLTGEATGPYHGGGVGVVVYNLTRQMAERGHEVYVFTSSVDPGTTTEHYGSITIVRYGKTFTVGQTPISLPLMYRSFSSGPDLDVVHAHLGNSPAPLSGYFSSRKKAPFLLTCHGNLKGGFGGPARRLGVFMENLCFVDFLLSRAERIIAFSDAHIDQSPQLQDYLEKVVIIPNGINPADFEISMDRDACRLRLGLPAEKQIVLFVGSLSPIKAPDVLVKAMKRVVEKNPEAFLVMVGDGPMRSELAALSQKLGIPESIRFAGFVSDEEKALYYHAADLFVLPSALTNESFGIVLLEASACSLPLVVSELDCFRAIVTDGYNGVTTKTGDDEDLAEKIVYLLENEDLRRRMGENARKNGEDFTWQRVAGQTEALYRELQDNRV